MQNRFQSCPSLSMQGIVMALVCVCCLVLTSCKVSSQQSMADR